MRDLLLWHACEELEHKSVAFDVLQKVNPSYLLRATGLVLASACLLGFWMAGTRHLLRQEPASAKQVDRGELREMRRHNVVANGAFARAFLEYLRPGFHPDQVDNYDLARSWLAENAGHLGFAKAA
jgi:predicted metal-dependent hydrolase